MLRLAHNRILLGQQAADFTVWVVHIAADDGVFGADNDAGWLQADVGAVGAIMAFSGRVRFRVNVDGVVRTGLHTGFTADTNGGVELNNTVSPLVHRLGGADADAGRVGAMVAARHLEMTPVVRESARFHIFDPGAVHPQGYFVFAFAGGGAGVTADTFTVVDDKTIILAWDA